jgi:septal ring factor EnvC (AmiA/AmiB activator)
LAVITLSYRLGKKVDAVILEKLLQDNVKQIAEFGVHVTKNWDRVLELIGDLKTLDNILKKTNEDIATIIADIKHLQDNIKRIEKK